VWGVFELLEIIFDYKVGEGEPMYQPRVLLTFVPGLQLSVFMTMKTILTWTKFEYLPRGAKRTHPTLVFTLPRLLLLID
jgi:hypothetical protein